jgi:hypothetical protein
MSNEEKLPARGNGPEQQANGPEQRAAVDTQMWIDDQTWVGSLTIGDSITMMDVTITAEPTLVLAANVPNMYAYATAMQVKVMP